MKVKTRTGIVSGKTLENGVEAFLGIPYAKQPVGDLRWRAPERLDNSDEEIECVEFGHSARQFIDEVELASLHEQGEDCLSLNVWVRGHERKNLPVMVYIHGGAYFSGGSADPLYNGSNFAAAKDVVIVSINYRLNLFGSLLLDCLPGGEDYKDAGYLAILDQIRALEWVHENISAFGGDPNCVTLFGESAGSSSQALLSILPEANKYFQRAILESGPIQLYKTRERGEYFAREFAEIMGCKTAQELLAKSADELIEGMQVWCDRHTYEVSLIFSPVCDGSFLPKKPMKAWAEGAAKDIDIMIGCTEDEFTYFHFYFDDLPGFWHGQFPIHFDDQIDIDYWEQAYRKAWPERDFAENYTNFMNSTGFFVGTDLMAEEQSAFKPVYNYLFRYKSRVEGMGSCHAIEVPFVFKNLDTASGLMFTGDNPPAHLADEMNDAWFSFAKTGKPFVEGKAPWDPYTAENHIHMVIDDNEWKPVHSLHAKEDSVFRPMYEVLLND